MGKNEHHGGERHHPDHEMGGPGGDHGRGGPPMQQHLSQHDDGGSGGERHEQEDIIPGAVTAGRLKTYIKPRIPTTQDVLDRRARKNAQSRARAAKLRERITIIEQKPDSERNKEEMDRILANAEKKRSKIERQFLDNALSAKKRKNEGDRLRRQRLKEMGLAAKGAAMKAAAMARAARHGYAAYPPPPYGYGGPPMSPMPMGYAQHPHMQSPGGFGSPPGMYPSPQHGGGGRPGGPPGTPQGGMPYMPPRDAYDPTQSPSNAYQNPGGGHGGPGRVEQRRHADGSMSISIGAEGAPGDGAPPQAVNGEVGEQAGVNISDVSHLLLYDNGEGGEGQNNANDEGK